MSRLADWFAIFRTGTHTDRHGVASTFDTSHLDGIVERFSAGDASCVITHDELYSPFGYAQIAEVKRDGDLLLARCERDTIEPQFAALVESGRLHNRSVQLIPELGGAGYRLGHVAFLGAEPPSVGGLPPLQHAAAAVRAFSVEDAWDKVRDANDRANLWEALRRVARRLLSQEETDELVPEWQANSYREDVGAARADAIREVDMSGNAAPVTYSAADIEAARAQGAGRRAGRRPAHGRAGHGAHGALGAGEEARRRRPAHARAVGGPGRARARDGR